PIWQIILRLFILPFRPKRVSQAYAEVWGQDSPMREILFEQVAAFKTHLTQLYPLIELNVVPAMTSGNPSIQVVLTQVSAQPQEHVILSPLFPQYSATSTAPLYDAVAKWVVKQRNLPGLTVIRDYYQHPLFIQSLAQSVRDYQAIYGQPEKLLMS